MNLQRCYEMLDIDETASVADIKQAYRDLIAIWHPDRHTSNPRLQEKATEKLKALNNAYDTLMAHRLTGGSPASVNTGASAKTAGHHMVVCSACGASNRIQFLQLKLNPKCGKCGRPLLQGDRAYGRDSSGTGPAGRQGHQEKTAQGSRTDTTRPAAGKRTRSVKQTVFIWMLVLIAISLAALKLLSEWPGSHLFSQLNSLLGKERQHAQNVTQDRTLDAAAADSDHIAGLQKSLLLMGYDSGPVDGKMGSRTIAAAQQFALDFRIDPGNNFFDKLVSQAARQAAIARQHPDWPDIVKNPDFAAWIENQTIASPDVCWEIRAAGTPQQVVNMVNAYKFDRFEPEPERLPPSGILQKAYYKGMAPLKIRARNEGRHYYIKLITIDEKKSMLTAFLRSGGLLTLHVPLGKYELKYAVGTKWYGYNWLFGNQTVFSRLDQVFEFGLDKHEISGYSIDLYLEPVPLTGAQKAYAFDF